MRNLTPADLRAKADRELVDYHLHHPTHSDEFAALHFAERALRAEESLTRTQQYLRDAVELLKRAHCEIDTLDPTSTVKPAIAAFLAKQRSKP